MSEPLRDLGRLVAEHQDETLLGPELAGEVTRGLAARRDRRARSARTRAFGLASLAAAALLLLVWFVGREPATPALAVPDELVAPAAEVPYAFPDGTTVLVGAGGQAKVVRSGPEGGEVALEHGKISVSVPPERGLNWLFRSGPYQVEVQGTRFDMAWDPETRVFDLEMFDGKVLVTAPGMEPRLVVAGQRISLSEKSSVAPRPPAPVADTVKPAPSLAPPSSSAAVASARPSAAPAERRSWQPLALEGNYVEAVNVAEEAGFASTLASSSASELLLLGDACRFAGKAARSREAYAAVRERHPGTKEAQRALFSLGALAFPNSSAVASFEQYLSEAPDGPLAPEALGRILEIKSRGADNGAARAAAERYLARFPNGAHSKLARRVLDEASP
jgi:hypothetical protein